VPAEPPNYDEWLNAFRCSPGVDLNRWAIIFHDRLAFPAFLFDHCEDRGRERPDLFEGKAGTLWRT
jgi:hypothetical protein